MNNSKNNSKINSIIYKNMTFETVEELILNETTNEVISADFYDSNTRISISQTQDNSYEFYISIGGHV